MFMIVLLIFASLVITRTMSGYDSRYNDRKHFVIHNNDIAKVLLPKTAGWQRGVNRTKKDFNKMTYTGAAFYFCNSLLLLSIPIFLFALPNIRTQPFEIDSRYIYIFVDTFNKKFPVLLTLILLSVEIVFEFLNTFFQSKKQNKKGMMIIALVLLVIILIFGILQVKELILTLIEVLS